MVLSEAEAETQLASLRRQRDALDRSISDLTLYLELGRRLTVDAGATEASRSAMPTRPARDESGAMFRANDLPETRVEGFRPAAPAAGPIAGFSSPPEADPATARPDRGPGSAPRMPEPAAATRHHADSTLSDGVLARRHGRALIEAALSALEEAGRPLHAGEILGILTTRGFSLPGQDPVAALNTRLWKRSGPGGPLKRMGDAVYALAEPDEG